MMLHQAGWGHQPPTPEEVQRQRREVVAFMTAVGPQDVLEAALAAQLCAVHNLGVRYLKLANDEPKQEIAGVHLSRAMRLITAYQRGLETLDRHRGRGQQTIRVERVDVHSIAAPAPRRYRKDEAAPRATGGRGGNRLETGNPTHSEKLGAAQKRQ